MNYSKKGNKNFSTLPTGKEKTHNRIRPRKITYKHLSKERYDEDRADGLHYVYKNASIVGVQPHGSLYTAQYNRKYYTNARSPQYYARKKFKHSKKQHWSSPPEKEAMTNFFDFDVRESNLFEIKDAVVSAPPAPESLYLMERFAELLKQVPASPDDIVRPPREAWLKEAKIPSLAGGKEQFHRELLLIPYEYNREIDGSVNGVYLVPSYALGVSWDSMMFTMTPHKDWRTTRKVTVKWYPAFNPAVHVWSEFVNARLEQFQAGGDDDLELSKDYNWLLLRILLKGSVSFYMRYFRLFRQYLKEGEREFPPISEFPLDF
jgi:hypothetical protein